ncbi:MAG: LysR substrate-binding domain-containing protein [Peptococcaceae bacterium]
MYTRSLLYFEEVVKEMSFTKAANNLYLSQQSLSQHIKRLEGHYGVQLFERKPSLSLTYAGELLLDHARQSFQEEERLLAEFSHIRSQQKGKIRFGITPTRAPIFIPRIIPRFNKLYPLVDLSLKEAHTFVLGQELLEGKIDVMIGIEETSLTSNRMITTVPLMDENQMYFLAPPNLLVQYKFLEERLQSALTKGIGLVEILSIPVILKPSHSHIHFQIAQAYLQFNQKPNIFVESSNVLPLLQLCGAGYAGVFMSRSILQHATTQYTSFLSNVLRLPILNFSINCSIVLMYLRGKPISSYFTSLIDIVKDVFKDYAAECEKAMPWNTLTQNDHQT